MLYINYKGATPQQRFYTIGVKGNNKSNSICFIVGATQDDIDLKQYACNLKVQNKEHSFGKEIYLNNKVFDEKTNTIQLFWFIPSEFTQFRNLELQLEFIGGSQNIIWQTLIVEIELNETIKVDDEKLTEQELSDLKKVEIQVAELDDKVTELDEQVEQAKEIVFGDPNDYLNENGLNKIIRPIDDNGNVNKSYMIDKQVTPSTLVVCEQHREENDFNYSYDENIHQLVIDFGQTNWETIFGEDNYFNDCTDLKSLYYVKGSEITKGVALGKSLTSYGVLQLNNAIPNKKIRVVVGKYFEYDQQGNKVFDEHCFLYSTNFVDTYGHFTTKTINITEEKQTIELQTQDDGTLYIETGSTFQYRHSRFILYGFEIGEPEKNEYTAKELGSGGALKRPTFIHYNKYSHKLPNTRNIRVDENCRVLINCNEQRNSKLCLGNWHKTSKGNRITNVAISSGDYSYTDFVKLIFGDSGVLSHSSSYRDLNDEYRTLAPTNFELKEKHYTIVYNFNTFIENNGINCYLKVLYRKYLRKIRKGKNPDTADYWGVSSMVNVRFVKDFEYKNGANNMRGWKGEMNANELRFWVCHRFKNHTKYTFVMCCGWKKI